MTDPSLGRAVSFPEIPDSLGPGFAQAVEKSSGFRGSKGHTVNDWKVEDRSHRRTGDARPGEAPGAIFGPTPSLLADSF